MQRPSQLCRLIIALWALVGASASYANEPSARESDLKAAFIYNFAKLSSWPAGTFARAEDPLVIGVIGGDEVAAALTAQLKAKQVAGHRIEIRCLNGAEPLPPLHVLYLGVAADPLLPGLAPAFVRTGLLTIGDSEAFVSRGGAIRFVVEASRLQFQINMTSAEKNGVKLSSQLLMLAKPLSPH